VSSISVSSSRGNMFSQSEADNKALELALKKAQLEKALAAAKGGEGDVEAAARAIAAKSSGGGSSGSGSAYDAAAAERDFQRSEYSRLESDKRKKDLLLTTAQQQTDLELERRRQSAAAAMGALRSFR
jgi:hypothetical protein